MPPVSACSWADDSETTDSESPTSISFCVRTYRDYMECQYAQWLPRDSIDEDKILAFQELQASRRARVFLNQLRQDMKERKQRKAEAQALEQRAIQSMTSSPSPGGLRPKQALLASFFSLQSSLESRVCLHCLQLESPSITLKNIRDAWPAMPMENVSLLEPVRAQTGLKTCLCQPPPGSRPLALTCMLGLSVVCSQLCA